MKNIISIVIETIIFLLFITFVSTLSLCTGLSEEDEKEIQKYELMYEEAMENNDIGAMKCIEEIVKREWGRDL